MKPDAGCWRVPLLIDGRKRIAPLIVAVTAAEATSIALGIADTMVRTGDPSTDGEPVLEHAPGFHVSADRAFARAMQKLKRAA